MTAEVGHDPRTGAMDGEVATSPDAEVETAPAANPWSIPRRIDGVLERPRHEYPAQRVKHAMSGVNV